MRHRSPWRGRAIVVSNDRIATLDAGKSSQTDEPDKAEQADLAAAVIVVAIIITQGRVRWRSGLRFLGVDHRGRTEQAKPNNHRAGKHLLHHFFCPPIGYVLQPGTLIPTDALQGTHPLQNHPEGWGAFPPLQRGGEQTVDVLVEEIETNDER